MSVLYSTTMFILCTLGLIISILFLGFILGRSYQRFKFNKEIIPLAHIPKKYIDEMFEKARKDAIHNQEVNKE